MPTYTHLTPADARRVPWKNGRGVTEEIAVGPAGTSFEAGDFGWRVSRAAVTEAGPFSSFPGVDRILVVTDGEGLVLTHGAGAAPVTVHRLAPHAFRGDDPTAATLVGGAVRDFNVLTRRGRYHADVQVIRPAPTSCTVVLPSCTVLVHAVDARASVTFRGRGSRTPTEWTLAAGDSLQVSEAAAPSDLTLSGDAGSAVILVTMTEDERGTRL